MDNLIKFQQDLELDGNLKRTDYIVLKIAEAETEEEKQLLRVKYAEELANRKKWRKELSELRAEGGYTWE